MYQGDVIFSRRLLCLQRTVENAEFFFSLTFLGRLEMVCSPDQICCESKPGSRNVSFRIRLIDQFGGSFRLKIDSDQEYYLCLS